MSGFEGSFLGKNSRIDPGSILECGVCWWVYDPAQGDETWQIPAGTAFADLPSHWRCPNCDNAPEQFMVVQGHQAAAGADSKPRPLRAAGLEFIREREGQLLAAYSAIAGRMRTLPVYNHELDIRVVGLHRWQEGLLGVVATPWCMNITLLPVEDTPARLEGTKRELAFPSGGYTFIAGQLAGVGPLETCSLFSPMDEFDDPAVVEQVARHALEALLTAPAAGNESPAMSRRHFLRGGSTRSRDSQSA